MQRKLNKIAKDTNSFLKRFIAKQKKSTWTHEIDIRAFSDQAWWNH